MFRRIRIFFLCMCIYAYKAKLLWVGEVPENSWWGYKKAEMELDLKRAENELAKLELFSIPQIPPGCLS